MLDCPSGLDLNIPNTTVGKDSVLRRLDAWCAGCSGGGALGRSRRQNGAPPRVTWIWSGVFGVGAWCWGATSGSEVGDLKDGAAGRGHQSSKGHRLQGQGMSELIADRSFTAVLEQGGVILDAGAASSPSPKRAKLSGCTGRRQGAGIQARGHLR